MMGGKVVEGGRFNEEKIENVEIFRYLGVWFDRGMRGNVHLGKIREKAEKWGIGIGCMSRVKGKMEVDRGRLIYGSY